MMSSDTINFLAGYEYRPGEFPRIEGYNARGLILGKGTPGLELLVYTGTHRPSKDGLHKAWKERLTGRGIPLLIVAIYDHHCSICGHSERSRGQIPVQPDLPVEHAERLCATALELPDHHTVDRFLRDHLPESQSSIFGIRNQGLLATYVLQRGEDEIGTDAWHKAAQKSIRLRDLKDKELLSGLGYAIEPLTGPASILTAKGSQLALAIFLDQNEIAELPSRRFGNQTPVSYALQLAQSHNLKWVIVSRGSEIRLYPTRTDVGVGRRGLTDTYLSLDLQLLPEKRLPFAWLILSAEGLRDDGFFKVLREKSERYAKDIGERLRDRIYTSVIPQLAMAMVKARKLKKPSSKDLDLTYQMAMLVLFRLLFVAYAEDHDLLPYRTNELYRSRSLTRLAHELKRIIDENHGFDPGSSLWNEVNRLWKAVRDGQSEWDIPPYNGGMFEEGKDHPAGAELAKISLSNREFGLILSFLLLDEDTPEGLGPVDFRSLGVREFGTIYEGLLENELSVADSNLTTDKKGHYKPTDSKKKVVVSEGEIYLHNKSGARKASGSYYTKSFAVDHLLDHSLEPALDEHLEKVVKAAKTDTDKASRMLFEFYVADIAMGSGHFLISAIDRIEKRFLSFLGDNPHFKGVDAELEKLRAVAREKLGEAVDERRLEKNQLLRRLIARRCIYGVDLNPLAVELARLSVWIHTFVPGLPLSFLDHNLVCGNSLVGIGTFDEVLEELTSKGHTLDLFEDPAKKWLGAAQKEIQALREISDADIGEIDKAKKAHEGIGKRLSELSAFFDILSAARLDKEIVKKMGSGAAGFLTKLTELQNLFGYALHKKARKATSDIPPFHFPIAFPEVFLRDRPGFDVIIGNPPWEEATIEEDAFWARHFPGLRGMRQSDQEILKNEYRKERSDLVRILEQEIRENDLLRRVLTTGPFPGMGTGDPDLYKAFYWRFWHLIYKDGGRLGVVLPRSAWFVKGSEMFRKEVFTDGRVEDITYLLNSGGWVFDDAEPRYTIALTSIEKSTPEKNDHSLYLRGPYRSKSTFDEGITNPPVSYKVEDVLGWTDTASLPLLPSEESAKVFLQMRKAPRLDADIGCWRCRPLRELDATNDRDLFTLTNDPPKGYWPVYKGESFDIWNPDTSKYYAWVEPEKIIEHLQKKRERGHRNARSVFFEFSDEWIKDQSTLPCLHPRIAFRDISRSTDSRTVRIALIPPNVVITNKGPTFLWPKGKTSHIVYLLAILSSIIQDWYSRRFVEESMNFYLINSFPIPRIAEDDKILPRILAVAGRLACLDRRFAEFAKAVGVKYGPLAEHEKTDMIHELDAIVAHLYGLSEKQLIHIFETFHVGWDYEERLRATLKHFKEWKKKV